MLSDVIKAARKRKGYTQRQLAEAAGLSLDSIKGFEGGSMPGADSLDRLRKVLDLTDPDQADGELLMTVVLPNGLQLQIRRHDRPG